jgi:hypothetical protein
MEARYANYFNVGYNVHEFLFDFGQFQFESAGQSNEPPGPVRIIRIVMGPPFAKSLLETLMRAVHEYEQLHGTVGQS